MKKWMVCFGSVILLASVAGNYVAFNAYVDLSERYHVLLTDYSQLVFQKDVKENLHQT